MRLRWSEPSDFDFARHKQVLSVLFLGMLIMKRTPQLIGYRDVKRTMRCKRKSIRIDSRSEGS